MLDVENKKMEDKLKLVQ
jgi:hypothetical protein